MTRQIGDPQLQGLPVVIQVLTGEYGAKWGDFVPPDGEEGLSIMAHNTTDDSARQYLFVGGKWRYQECK